MSQPFGEGNVRLSVQRSSFQWIAGFAIEAKVSDLPYVVDGSEIWRSTPDMYETLELMGSATNLNWWVCRISSTTRSHFFGWKKFDQISHAKPVGWLPIRFNFDSWTTFLNSLFYTWILQVWKFELQKRTRKKRSWPGAENSKHPFPEGISVYMCKMTGGNGSWSVIGDDLEAKKRFLKRLSLFGFP